ncbi:hypothetical protein [Lederbergia lenta]|uniref:Uncharacterized protein n=1 Tax=Lederbergia lenta TaxID=1467 RepID=A0A2X4W6F8_LEDLE|nr:hypothetical protein [Lederbergia lenta]MCM3109781.1 hypothetical protein [Lederbergia lenta]MEC2324469.1 hypothetical protein [Lederbergia lenta]SQI59806.1 Uncharacterised protein [Lederbergia lenta]
MPETDEIIIFIREMGRLFDEYYRSPDHLKSAILEDIFLLGNVIRKPD